MLVALPLAPVVLLTFTPPRPFNMNDLSSRSAAGAELMVGDMELDTILGTRDIDLYVLQLSGDFVVARDFALTVRMPFAQVVCEGCFDVLLNDDEQLAVGNLTLGGRFRRLDGPLGVGAHLSYSGLTASDDYSNEGRAAQLAAAFFLFRDAGWFLPDTHTIRLGGDVRYAFGRPFLQVQLALHQLIAEEIDDDGDDDDDFTVLRLVAGGGVSLTYELALLAELVTTSTALDDDDEDADVLFDNDDFFHVLDVGLRYEGARASVAMRLSLPLDYGNLDDTFGFGLEALARF